MGAPGALVDAAPGLIERLLRGLGGRAWDGKECLSTALASVVAACPRGGPVAAAAVRPVVDALCAECGRRSGARAVHAAALLAVLRAHGGGAPGVYEAVAGAMGPLIDAAPAAAAGEAAPGGTAASAAGSGGGAPAAGGAPGGRAAEARPLLCLALAALAHAFPDAVIPGTSSTPGAAAPSAAGAAAAASVDASATDAALAAGDPALVAWAYRAQAAAFGPLAARLVACVTGHEWRVREAAFEALAWCGGARVCMYACVYTCARVCVCVCVCACVRVLVFFHPAHTCATSSLAQCDRKGVCGRRFCVARAECGRGDATAARVLRRGAFWRAEVARRGSAPR